VVEVAALQGVETGGSLTLLASSSRDEGALHRAVEACAAMAASRGVALDASKVETLVRSGDPAKVLGDVARERGADLVAVGNHAVPKRGRELVSGAQFDVLIVHTTSTGWLNLTSREYSPESTTYQRTFLVGVHGSDHSLHVAEKAGVLAADLNAELILVGAYERAAKQYSHGSGGWKSLSAATEPVEGGSSEIESALSDAEALARRSGATKVKTAAVPGDPMQVLLNTADQYDADVIVVGNHPFSTGTSHLVTGIIAKASRKSPQHLLLVH
jgi:nucleotide-binding universal stress UspA family protein